MENHSNDSADGSIPGFSFWAILNRILFKFVKVVDYGIGMGHMKVYGSYQSGIILVGRIA